MSEESFELLFVLSLHVSISEVPLLDFAIIEGGTNNSAANGNHDLIFLEEVSANC